MKKKSSKRLVIICSLALIFIILPNSISAKANIEDDVNISYPSTMPNDTDEVTSQQILDKIAPEFMSISIDKTQVSASNAVTVTVSATDDTDSILDVFVYFQMPVTNEIKTIGLKKNAVGKYVGTYQITNETEIGVWKIKYIFLSDSSYNSRIIYNENLFSQPGEECQNLEYCDFEVIKTTGSDSTAPVFQGISIDKKLALSGDTVTVMVEAKDYENSPINIYVYYESPLTKNIETISLNKNTEGKYVGSYLVTNKTEIGVWKISSITLTDSFNNSNTIYNQYIDGYYYEKYRNFTPYNFTVTDAIVDVTDITLNKTTTKVKFGTDFDLIATVSPENATNKTVIWSSDHQEVASVDYTGKVKTRMEGTAIITATSKDGLKSASCTVTVVDPLKAVFATDVIMNETSKTLIVGSDFLLTAKIEPLDVSNKLITWSSDLNDVVTVKDGKITAIKPGVATIRATSGDKFATGVCYVTVTDAIVNVTDLTMYQPEIKLETGTEYTFTATVSPENATNKSLNWSSNQEEIATVDSYGNVTTHKSGTAIITAETVDGHKTASCLVTVYDKLESIDVSYQTHVQDVGWQGFKIDGEISGTSGRSLRLEGIQINVENNKQDVGVEYQTHVENIGWQDLKSDGDISGTSGKSLRLEAIKVNLNGSDADKYDIYYCVHAQNVGWMGWAKNGQSSGTEGFGYRLEGIRILIVPRGTAAPGSTDSPFLRNQEIN